MGNPPYLGSKLQDESQKEDMKIALADVKDKRVLIISPRGFGKVLNIFTIPKLSTPL